MDYICSRCSETFGCMSSFKKHERLHSGDVRWHICDDCQGTFSDVNHLRRHRMIHTAEFPFTCAHCNKGFRRKIRLQDHVAVQAH